MDQEKVRKTERTGTTLKQVWDNPWFTIPALLFLVAGLAAPLRFYYGEEIILLNGLRKEPWNTFFASATRLGETPAFIVAGLIALLFRYRITLLVVMAGLMTMPVSYYLKDAFGKDRPITYFEKNNLRDQIILVPDVRMNGGQTSFPSGHTMAAFALYASLAAVAGRRRPVISLTLALFSILTAFSRVFLVQHFAYDVVAGAILGLGLAWLAVLFNNRLPVFGKAELDTGLLSGA
jgi:membrane-associated phospholipid phosphatase